VCTPQFNKFLFCAEGFEDVLDACCGAGGPHNMDPIIDCGLDGSYSCPDPSKYISWDGLHMTEAANKYIAQDILTILEGLHMNRTSNLGPLQMPPVSLPVSNI
jgi:GDSL-like Lipase/Acylhydrolase